MNLSEMLRTNFEMTGRINQFKKKICVLTTLGLLLNDQLHSWLTIPLIEDVMFLSNRGRLQ